MYHKTHFRVCVWHDWAVYVYLCVLYPVFDTLQISHFELPNAHQIQYRAKLTDGQTVLKVSGDLISK